MTFELDLDLMRRYEGAGPRYTSYPTANLFHPGFERADYERAVQQSVGTLSGLPLSLYLHIPFCSSPCFYCACTRVISRQPSMVAAYARRLLQEIAMRSQYFDRTRPVEQLHFGGGTPTSLDDEQLIDIFDALHRGFQLTDAPSRDYAIEVDPRTIDSARLRFLMSLGFNRLSFGVQDFDLTVQRAINRIQSVQLVERLTVEARNCGFDSINFDLIYGLPHQTVNSFGKTLQEVVRLRPDRVAAYGYAHMPKMFKAQNQIRDFDLPSSAQRLALLALAVRELTAAGYVHIGMDHFALPGDSLAKAFASGTLHRNFQGYTSHANRDLVSFGLSAIGKVGRLYVQNFKGLDEYSAGLAAGQLPLSRGMYVSANDLVRADVIQDIMCRGSLDFRVFSARHHVPFWTFFNEARAALERFRADGLIQFDADGLRLTDIGRYLMRSVAMIFDEYVERGQDRAQRPQLSKVI